MPRHRVPTQPPASVVSLEEARQRRAARSAEAAEATAALTMGDLLGLLGMDPAHVHAFQRTGLVARDAAELPVGTARHEWQQAVHQWRPTGDQLTLA